MLFQKYAQKLDTIREGSLSRWYIGYFGYFGYFGYMWYFGNIGNIRYNRNIRM
jgi:hypothetical protein